MIIYYVIALVPIVIGAILTRIFPENINIKEWAVTSVIAIFTAAILHACTYFGMTTDTEIWSGKITEATWYPQYVERYEEAVYRTVYDEDGDSHQEFSHYETCYRTHYPYGTATAWYGNESENITIDKLQYDNILKQFGKMVQQYPHKNGFYSGDSSIYVAINSNNVLIPTTTQKEWCNKVKASPSAFSFKNVDKASPVFEYPNQNNQWKSNRLLGDAKKIDVSEFDKMCSNIGLKKKVNVIILGFNSADKNLGYQQEEKWLRGKKNDIVICYGYAPLEENKSSVVWTYCFGWSRDDKVLRNLEKIMFDNEINNAILPIIEKEILTNYVKKDWTQIDLIKVSPSSGWLWFYCIFLLLTQICAYVFAYSYDEY